MPACRYVEEISSAAKRSAGVISEVNLRELVTNKPLPCVNEAAHSGFENPEETLPEVQSEASDF